LKKITGGGEGGKFAETSRLKKVRKETDTAANGSGFSYSNVGGSGFRGDFRKRGEILALV